MKRWPGRPNGALAAWNVGQIPWYFVPAASRGCPRYRRQAVDSVTVQQKT
jgi:hypothetical protein